jgi:hypothetical protein
MISLKTLQKKTLKSFWKVPPVLVFFILLYYCFIVLFNISEDTTKITNIGFGIVAVLAGLSFSASSALPLNEKFKDDFLYAGERFFHAALFLLLASLLKYAAFNIENLEYFAEHEFQAYSFTFIMRILTGLIFLFALFESHTGFRVANDSLWQRMSRMKDWDDIV